MSKFTYSDGVAVWQLVYYCPAFILSAYVAYKHGFAKSSGWIYLTIFCTLRIVGSAAQLYLVSNPLSNDAATIALICSVMGLSPLLLASLGLLARSFYSMLKQPYSTIFSLVILKITQVLALVALILCIVGATDASSASDINNETTIKVGVVLFLLVFVIEVILTGLAYLLSRQTEEGEVVLMHAVAFALPLILVRIIYALIVMFGHYSDFALGNNSTGAVTIKLFMEVLEECVVVVIYLAVGLMIKTVPLDNASQGETLRYRLGRGDFNTGKLGILSLGAAVAQSKRRAPMSQV